MLSQQPAGDRGAPRVGRPRDPEIDAAVIRAAQLQLAEHGYDGVSIASVAEAAGTSRQALYRRFATKADLVTAAIAALAEERRAPTSDDPFTDLVAELESFRRGVLRPNGVSLVGTMLQFGVDHELRARYQERVVRPRRNRLTEILRRARDAGLVDRDADLDLAAAACTGTLYALQLAGAGVPRDWSRRTAALVWRACGGEPPA